MLAEIARNTGGSTFFRRAQLARFIEERLADHASSLSGDLLAAIAPVATAVRRRDGGTDRTLLLASVLLDRDAVPRLHQRVDATSARHRGSVTVTIGPARPPQEFVTTRFEPERGRGR